MCMTHIRGSQRLCPRWAEIAWIAIRATNAEILILVEEYSRSGTAFVFTDGSVRRGVKSHWTYSARQNGVVVAEETLRLLRLPRACVWR